MHNGCVASVAVCNASDPESVSTAQMPAELSYLYSQVYRTVQSHLRNVRAAFVEDATENGVLNQRFRLDVQGWMTEGEFESMLTAYLAAGNFNG